LLHTPTAGHYACLPLSCLPPCFLLPVAALAAAFTFHTQAHSFLSQVPFLLALLGILCCYMYLPFLLLYSAGCLLPSSLPASRARTASSRQRGGKGVGLLAWSSFCRQMGRGGRAAYAGTRILPSRGGGRTGAAVPAAGTLGAPCRRATARTACCRALSPAYHAARLLRANITALSLHLPYFSLWNMCCCLPPCCLHLFCLPFILSVSIFPGSYHSVLPGVAAWHLRPSSS